VNGEGKGRGGGGWVEYMRGVVERKGFSLIEVSIVV
jgi:hypothetical protein